jgi:hypothetical protein
MCLTEINMLMGVIMNFDEEKIKKLEEEVLMLYKKEHELQTKIQKSVMNKFKDLPKPKNEKESLEFKMKIMKAYKMEPESEEFEKVTKERHNKEVEYFGVASGDVLLPNTLPRIISTIIKNFETKEM